MYQKQHSRIFSMSHLFRIREMDLSCCGLLFLNFVLYEHEIKKHSSATSDYGLYGQGALVIVFYKLQSGLRYENRGLEYVKLSETTRTE